MGWAEGGATRVEETCNDQQADDDEEVGGVVHCGRVGRRWNWMRTCLGHECMLGPGTKQPRGSLAALENALDHLLR